MEIKNVAMAGTLESSDVQVTIEPAVDGYDLNIDSTVINQFGKQIKAVILETLQDLGVKAAKITVIDRGALDCTIRARTECAVYRAAAKSGENIPWRSAKQ